MEEVFMAAAAHMETAADTGKIKAFRFISGSFFCVCLYLIIHAKLNCLEVVGNEMRL